MERVPFSCINNNCCNRVAEEAGTISSCRNINSIARRKRFGKKKFRFVIFDETIQENCDIDVFARAARSLYIFVLSEKVVEYNELYS